VMCVELKPQVNMPVMIQGWLGGRDSNPDTQLQRLQSYR
jgi:hypothetical protein